jgi:hypothetical protein
MATWRNNLGHLLAGLGDLDGARTRLERAIEITEATLATTTPMSPSFAAISTGSCIRLVIPRRDLDSGLAGRRLSRSGTVREQSLKLEASDP